MSPEKERWQRGWNRQAREERRTSIRPALVHGRRIEAEIDVTQLPISESIQLRDPESGECFFVIGYSQIDGPDIVAP